MKAEQTVRNVNTENNHMSSLEILDIHKTKTKAQEISKLLYAPLNPDPSKQNEIDAELEKRITRLGLAIGLEVDRRARFHPEEAEKDHFATEQRLSQACREIIAEIRPVGGTLTPSEFSRKEEAGKLQETVGMHYPSSWIEASESAGRLAIKVAHDRGHYVPQEPYDSDDIDATLDVYKSCLLAEQAAQHIHSKLSEDGDVESATLAGYPFASNGLSLQVLSHKIRVPFNPSKDVMGAAGVPVGDGWNYGFIIDELSALDTSGKKWYRIKTRPGQYVSTLYVPPIGESESTALYHHEFCHRIEDTLGVKDDRGRTILHRLQEAFLRRRTIRVDGTREPLVNLGARTFDFEKIELGRPSDFMIAYVGKEYITSYAREVLSVGAEAMLENRFGSFHGLGGKGKKDLDHRGFTLGIFATA